MDTGSNGHPVFILGCSKSPLQSRVQCISPIRGLQGHLPHRAVCMRKMTCECYCSGKKLHFVNTFNTTKSKTLACSPELSFLLSFDDITSYILAGHANRALHLLKLQYFGRLIRRADSLEMTLMLGKIGGEGGDRR